MAGKMNRLTRFTHFSALVYDVMFGPFCLGSENNSRRGLIKLGELLVMNQYYGNPRESF